jgi:hypothetical protein
MKTTSIVRGTGTGEPTPSNFAANAAGCPLMGDIVRGLCTLRCKKSERTNGTIPGNASAGLQQQSATFSARAELHGASENEYPFGLSPPQREIADERMMIAGLAIEALRAAILGQRSRRNRSPGMSALIGTPGFPRQGRDTSGTLQMAAGPEHFPDLDLLRGHWGFQARKFARIDERRPPGVHAPNERAVLPKGPGKRQL